MDINSGLPITVGLTRQSAPDIELKEAEMAPDHFSLEDLGKMGVLDSDNPAAIIQKICAKYNSDSIKNGQKPEYDITQVCGFSIEGGQTGTAEPLIDPQTKQQVIDYEENPISEKPIKPEAIISKGVSISKLPLTCKFTIMVDGKPREHTFPKDMFVSIAIPTNPTKLEEKNFQQNIKAAVSGLEITMRTSLIGRSHSQITKLAKQTVFQMSFDGDPSYTFLSLKKIKVATDINHVTINSNRLFSSFTSEYSISSPTYLDQARRIDRMPHFRARKVVCDAFKDNEARLDEARQKLSKPKSSDIILELAHNPTPSELALHDANEACEQLLAIKNITERCTRYGKNKPSVEHHPNFYPGIYELTKFKTDIQKCKDHKKKFETQKQIEETKPNKDPEQIQKIDKDIKATSDALEKYKEEVPKSASRLVQQLEIFRSELEEHLKDYNKYSTCDLLKQAAPPTVDKSAKQAIEKFKTVKKDHEEKSIKDCTNLIEETKKLIDKYKASKDTILGETLETIDMKEET